MAGDSKGAESSERALEALEDRVFGKVKRERRGGGSRGKAGGGRGGGGGLSREIQVSKALSKLLRHQAENANIPLDGEGFAPLNQVLAWGPLKSLNVTLADIQSIVSSNDKQRFSVKLVNGDLVSLARASADASTDAADYLIRANQGHSIKLESAALLSPITEAAGNVPARVLHGTYFYFWPQIVAAGGLKVMGRNHVHCSTGTPEEGVVSGMRRDAELIVEIDVAASLADGLTWWRSDNGVLLTEGDAEGVLSSRYFKAVTGRQIDVGVLWQDGQWVADIPAGFKINPPMGKGRGGGRGGGGGGRGGHGGRRGS
ncbi:KptA family-domain-containing protein [Dactylonectria macrodidyma]|uniref:2'-phosphotransferase n=1 Tax=Dactylonectria macrodidyma TaxID=307937 RepID=A0A9P9FPZ4_9HYPO|nr:KptA family-domain-containing protein [Dactylonectria macrodidyma]